MFRLLYSVQLEKPTASCESCGHAIAQCFYISDENGKQMVVGSECVNTHLSPSDQSAKKQQQRLSRAAAQWRKQKPEPKDGETRTQYINRRVEEMSNAMGAYRAWAVLFTRGRTFYTVGIERLKAQGIIDPRVYSFISAPDWAIEQRRALACEYDRMVQDEYKQFVTEFECAHKANVYDFNQPSYKVAKV